MRRSDRNDEQHGRMGPLPVSAVFLTLAALTSLYQRVRFRLAGDEQADAFSRTFCQQDAPGAGGGV
jgi:hypothetical protein